MLVITKHNSIGILIAVLFPSHLKTIQKLE